MRKKKKLCLFICVVIFLVLYNWREAVNEEFLVLDSCPACYGENQCNRILKDGNIALISPSKWKLFNKLLNVKNVFYGQTTARNYVLKKLAHNSELLQFDKNICHLSGYSSACNVSYAISTLIEGNNRDVILTVKKFNNLLKNNDAIKCNQDKILTLLFNKFSSFDDSPENLHHFLTLMALNPEPVILQAFHGIFPLPLYLGSCGRVVVEEYVGRPLSKYYQEPWVARARLAVQLLKMAISMSENVVRMYITDPSSDNFAVDQDGTLKLIDAENVVLVDSQHEGLDSQPHFNDGIGCRNCFSFDYEELCSHYWCDHNYFAVCKGLLSSNPFSSSLPGGLLHSIPTHVEMKMNISKVIDECAMPTATRDRRSLAKELLRLLQAAIHYISANSRTASELRK